VAVRENRVEAVVVAFVDMASWDFGFRRTVHKGRAEPGVVPGINLFKSPNLKGAEAVKDSDCAGDVIHIGQMTAGVVPIVDEWPVCSDPLVLAAARICTTLCVGNVITNERIGQSAWSAIRIFRVRIHAWTGINLFAINVWPTEVLPPVKILLPWPSISVPVGQVIIEILTIHQDSETDLPLIAQASGGAPFFLSLAQCGQQQRSQNRNDGNHHQQFNKSKRPAWFRFHFPSAFNSSLVSNLFLRQAVDVFLKVGESIRIPVLVSVLGIIWV